MAASPRAAVGQDSHGGGSRAGGEEEGEQVYYYRPWWYRPLLIGASALCTAFAAGYQAIAVAGWLQYFLLLRFLEWDRRRLRHWIAAWLLHALGFLLAMAGSFNDPTWTASGPAAVMVVALVVAALEVLCALVYVTMAQRYSERLHAKVFSFPVCLTAVWFLWGLVSPTGAFGHPATSQWTLPPIVQLTSIFGLDGLLFLMAWTAAVFASYFNVYFGPPSDEEEEDDGDRPFSSLGPEAQRDLQALARKVAFKARCQLATWSYVVLFLLLVGGANITVFHSYQFYQKTLPQTIGARTPLKLGCVVASDVARNESEDLWRRTEAAAAMGNDLIVWSEEALVLHGQAEEAETVAEAAALAVQHQVHLGITYQLFDPGSPTSPTDPGADAATEGPYANVFTLLRPDGTVGFRYAKRHPVPVVEADAVAGHSKAPPYVDTPWGRVGGSICFDLQFPLWAKEAGRARVALMLQPSWTWGPLGQLHAFDSAIRGVENGFAVFRCSSGGVSGYWDATYGVQSLTYTTDQSNGPSQVIVPPPQARVTLYPWVGFVFGWLALAFACGYLIVLLGPGEKAMRVAAANFRRGGAGPVRRTGGAGPGAGEALMSPAEEEAQRTGWTVK